MSRCFVAAVVATAAASLQAQVETSRLPSTETTSVVVDVVVRDGKGQPVTDLVASDFEVLEDGVAQSVERFAPPSAVAAEVAANPGRAAVAASRPSATDPAPVRSPAMLAFVFDRLSIEGRLAAQRAAREYLKERQPDDVAGVFSIEGTLVVLQSFTDDPALVEAAIEDLGSRVAQSGSNALDRKRALTAGRLTANAANATVLELSSNKARNPMALAMARIQATGLSVAQAAAEMFDQLERDQHGFVTANALTAIVDALRAAPGRKAVVLFSEGLFRTEANENRFLSVVHGANRASVSIYTIEAAGLQTTTYERQAREEIISTANLSNAQQASGLDSGGGAWMRGLEGVQDTVRYHPRGSLEWISDRTGGVFVRDTNDLSGALRRIGSDLRTYYLIGYTPRNEQYDGRFRKIAVSVRRKGLEVRARAGYFAVRSAGPVLAHVAPALAILEGGKRPHDLELVAGAWIFPEGEGVPARVPVAVTVPAAGVAKLGGKAKGKLDVTLLARILDADRRPVDAMSRRFVVDPSKPPGDLLLLRDAWLGPGHYTVEAVVYEAAGSRAGVTTLELEVGKAPGNLDRAQVFIVKSAVPAAGAPVELESAHPLRFGEVILLPVGGESLAGRGPRPFIVQVTVPPSRTRPPPTGVVSIWDGQKSIGQGGLKWAAPDASGFLRHVAEVPGGTPPKGRYELRVTLNDVASERVLSVPFSVSE